MLDYTWDPKTEHLPRVSLVLDVETTGLDINRHQVTEFGGILVWSDTLEEIDTFSVVINPGSDAVWDDVALDMAMASGLYDELPDGKTYEQANSAAQAWLATHLGPRALVAPIGINVADFDVPRVRLWLPSVAQRFCYRIVDLTGPRTLFKLAGLPYRKPEDVAHRALPDCAAELEELRSCIALARLIPEHAVIGACAPAQQADALDDAAA